MELKISMIELESFKGVRHKVIKFKEDIVKVLGQNGSGKSTLANAFYWVFADCDYELNKNPNVIPLGEAECKPTVKIWMTIDGKDCSVEKQQTVKVKTVDDKVTTSLTNNYSINEVEKSYRDFVADLKERGIDMDRFLILSNPNAFTSDSSKKGREEMRKVLFEMAEEVSDEDIAKDMDVPELTALLENYKLEEIEQMQRSTLRKITEICGKSNEIIDARISGILQSKSQVDVKELTKTKEEHETELKKVRENAQNLLNGDNEIKREIAELEGKLIELEEADRKKLYAKIDKTCTKYNEAQAEVREKQSIMNHKKSDMDAFKYDMDGIAESLEKYRELYKKVQEEVFDKDSTVCPSCGREYPKDKVDEIKKNFEDGKAKRLKDYKDKGLTYASKLEKLQNEYEEAKDAYEQANKDWKAAMERADKYEEDNHKIPRNPDMTANKKYMETKEQIEKLREELNTKGDLKLQELSNRESYLIQMINQIIGELALADKNKELDEQVSKLRKEKKDAEVNRAKAEKILFQVEKFKMHKNDLLTEEINKHFDGVSFRLFRPQKNGEIIECLDVLVDGKEINSQANQALQVKAKLALIKGLSLFWNVIFPVFVDDASLLTQDTLSTIDMPNQMIWLCAKDGYKEIEIQDA